MNARDYRHIITTIIIIVTTFRFIIRSRSDRFVRPEVTRTTTAATRVYDIHLLRLARSAIHLMTVEYYNNMYIILYRISSDCQRRVTRSGCFPYIFGYIFFTRLIRLQILSHLFRLCYAHLYNYILMVANDMIPDSKYTCVCVCVWERVCIC